MATIRKIRMATQDEVYALLRDLHQVCIDVGKKHSAGMQTFSEFHNEDWQSRLVKTGISVQFVFLSRLDADSDADSSIEAKAM